MTVENRMFVESGKSLIMNGLASEKIATMFERAMHNTLDTTVKFLNDGSVFLITGDIPAMWLRDSVCQVRPYLLFCNEHDELKTMLLGLLKQQFAFINLDPYANAFNETANGAGHQDDLTDMGPQIWERKYEIDSLCYPVQLAYLFWQITGETKQFDAAFSEAVAKILQVWEVEQRHMEQSGYRFERPNPPAVTDTLPHQGMGNPVQFTGMTWSGFRPSDDACTYGYLVPANAFAVVVLGYIQEIAVEVLADNELAERAAKLQGEIQQGIEKFALKQTDAGDVLAYEVDGNGNQLMMDDANVPSLLSLPMLGALKKDDPLYLRTRAYILSDNNPYYHEGKYARGIGSPHTPAGSIWHIALAVQGLTASSKDEQRELIDMMVHTDAGTGLMHESFDPDNPDDFTRPWFSWANAMFCELVLDYCGLSIDSLINK